MSDKLIIHSDRLSQSSIKNFFKPHVGPLKFDFKPLETFSAPRKNKSIKWKYTKQNSERFDLELSTKMKSRNGKRKTQSKSNYEKETEEIDDDLSQVNMPTQFLSPQIILHEDEEEVQFISESHESLKNDTFNPEVSGSPSKKSKYEDICSQKVYTGFMSVTKSKMQCIEVSKKSRALQIKNDIFDLLEGEENTDNISDVTVTYNYNCESQENFQANLLNVSSAMHMIEEMNFRENTEIVESDHEIHKNQISYHLTLINKIIDNASKLNFHKLLFPTEKELLEEFHKMPSIYKFVCCKLFTHIEKWYNFQSFLSKINLNLSAAEAKKMYMFMKEKNFICNDYTSESSVYLLELLKVEDVKNIFNSFKLRSKMKKKSDLIKAILNHVNTQTTLVSTKSMDKILQERIIKKLGICIKIKPAFYNMFYKIHLLYSFTNSELFRPSDLYHHISQIQNEHIYMPIVTLQDTTIFENAEVFSRFARASHCRNELHLAFENKKITLMIELSLTIYNELKCYVQKMNTEGDTGQNIPTYLKQFSAGHVYASALTFACGNLTKKCSDKVKEWLEFLLYSQTYCERKRGVWYCLLAMVQNVYFKDYEGTIKTIIAGLNDGNMSLIDINELSIRGKSLCKKKSKIMPELIQELSSLLEKQSFVYKFPQKIIDAVSNHGGEIGQKSQYKYVNNNGDTEYLSVEEIALRHYTNEGFTHGIHCEGALIMTIFFVLFWDIIYNSNIPNTYILEVQFLPLDFYSEDFYANRKDLIDKRLKEIESDWLLTHLERYIIETWHVASNTKSLAQFNLVSDCNELFSIIVCIGRKTISQICKRLIENVRNHSAGLPDLFVWNDIKYKFVEVKGQGDKLSTKQNLWLDFLKSIGAAIEVCHVHTVGSRRGEKYKSSKKSNKERNGTSS